MSHKSQRTTEKLLERQAANQKKRTKRAKELDKETRQLKDKPPTPSRRMFPAKARSEFDWFTRARNWKLHTRRQRATRKAVRKNHRLARRITLVYNRKRP